MGYVGRISAEERTFQDVFGFTPAAHEGGRNRQRPKVDARISELKQCWDLAQEKFSDDSGSSNSFGMIRTGPERDQARSDYKVALRLASEARFQVSVMEYV